MMKAAKLENFIFATSPNVRRKYVELGIRYKCKRILMEEPLTLNFRDAPVPKALCMSKLDNRRMNTPLSKDGDKVIAC